MKATYPVDTVEDTDSSITTTSPPGSTHLPLSRRSSMSSVFTATATPLEISTVQFSLATMESGFQSISDFLDELEKSTMQIGILGDGRIEAQLDEIRKNISNQDKDHENGLKEVELVFKDMMEQGLIGEIQKDVEDQVEEEVNRVVEEQFTEYLKKHVPNALVQELTETRAKLNASRVQLHNSEAIRANALLRKDRGDGSNRQIVHKLYRSDGTVSPLFPKTLQDAFDLDKETCKTLLQDYGVEISHKAKGESLLNSFLKRCGIPYQLVNQGGEQNVRQVHDFESTTPAANEGGKNVGKK